jgi:molybdopterin synthase catalytic subunit
LEDLISEARDRWRLAAACVVHRLGHLELGEVAVAVAVSAPHRREAFEACQWLMDTIKREVPIWKRERYEDGGEEWIHPGAKGGRNEEAAHEGRGGAG